jgi:hypothetical protein
MSAQQQKPTQRTRGAPEAKRAAAKAGQPDAAERLSRISMAAYFIAERRGFSPGHELDDWLAAEAEINGSATPSTVTSIEISRSGRTS